MIIISLTENQLEVLEKIVAFSGYATKETIAAYKNIAPHSAYELLKALETQGMLRSLKYFSDSNKPLIYQVKLAACKELGRGDSYLRRNHTVQSVQRYLIYSHFCFNIMAKKGYPFDAILNSSNSRIAYLKQLGATESEIPGKYNFNKSTGKRDKTLQVEEYILTLPPFALGKGFCIAYADKPWQPPLGQLATIFKRYHKLLLHFSFPPVILVVAENKERLQEYITIFEQRFKSQYKGRLKFLGYSLNYDYTP